MSEITKRTMNIDSIVLDWIVSQPKDCRHLVEPLRRFLTEVPDASILSSFPWALVKDCSERTLRVLDDGRTLCDPGDRDSENERKKRGGFTGGCIVSETPMELCSRRETRSISAYSLGSLRANDSRMVSLKPSETGDGETDDKCSSKRSESPDRRRRSNSTCSDASVQDTRKIRRRRLIREDSGEESPDMFDTSSNGRSTPRPRPRVKAYLLSSVSLSSVPLWSVVQIQLSQSSSDEDSEFDEEEQKGTLVKIPSSDSYGYAQVIGHESGSVVIAWFYRPGDIIALRQSVPGVKGGERVRSPEFDHLMCNLMYLSDHRQTMHDCMVFDVSDFVVWTSRIGRVSGIMCVGGFYRADDDVIDTDAEFRDTRRLRFALDTCLQRGTGNAVTMTFARGPWTECAPIQGTCDACGLARRVSFRDDKNRMIGETCHKWMVLASQIDRELTSSSRDNKTIVGLLDSVASVAANA